MKLSIKQFAAQVGNHTVAIKDAADAFHTAYTGANPEQQRALRSDWMLGHLEGQGVKNPERTFSLGKGAGSTTDGVKAIDRAYSDFRYYVVRPVKAKPVQAKSHRISKELRATGMDFLSQFDGETLDAQIKAAVALLKALA
jgi:hypothetical protein